MWGSMDASRYKDYMLGLLLYKFLSEKNIEGFKAATRCQGTLDKVLAQYGQMFEKMGEQIKKALMKTPGYYVETQYLYYTWMLGMLLHKAQMPHRNSVFKA